MILKLGGLGKGFVLIKYKFLHPKNNRNIRYMNIFNKSKNKKLEFYSVLEVVSHIKEYLPGRTEYFTSELDKFYNQSTDLIKKHNPKCLYVYNSGQEFDLTFGLINQNDEYVNFYEYELLFNDGNNFGIDDYDYEIPNYPTEDMFQVFRMETAQNLFMMWILECVWNSKLIETKIPLIYVASTDFDEIYDLKDGVSEYHDLDFLQ